VLPALNTLNNYFVLAVDDGDDVFISSYTLIPPNDTLQYNVIEFPANGGSPVTLSTGDDQHLPLSLAIDGAGDLFLVEGYILYTGESSISVLEYPAGGGAPFIRLPGKFLTLDQVVVDALGNLFFTESHNDLYDLPAGASAAISLPFNNRSSESNGFAMDGLGDLFVGEYFTHFVPAKTEVVKVLRPAAPEQRFPFQHQALIRRLQTSSGMSSLAPTPPILRCRPMRF
jgi:hypothetical protein